jgi:hypothetical protein
MRLHAMLLLLRAERQFFRCHPYQLFFKVFGYDAQRWTASASCQQNSIRRVFLLIKYVFPVYIVLAGALLPEAKTLLMASQ